MIGAPCINCGAAECACLADLHQALCELDEETQAQVDADIEHDRRNADRTDEFEPRWAFLP